MSNQPKGIGQKRKAPEQSEEERYYTIEELADMWKVSPRMVERVFKNYPGVVETALEDSAESSSRIRIPHSVAKLVTERSDPAILDKS